MIWTVLTCVGITMIVTRAAMLRRVRPAWYLFSCPMCAGVWVGMIYGYIYGIDLLTLSSVTSLTSWLLISLGDLLEVRSHVHKKVDASASS